MSNQCKLYEPSDHEIEAARIHVASRVVGLRDLDDGQGLGSAVCIKMGNRYFLATAAHVISTGHHVEVIMKQGEQPISDYANSLWDDETADVGLLELAKEQADRLESFVDETSLCTSFDAKSAWSVLVGGYPGSQYVPIQRGQIGAVGMIVLCRTVPLSEWPNDWPPADIDSRELGPPHPQKDILVNYPNETDIQISGPGLAYAASRGRSGPTPHPSGVSGGGIWLVLFQEKKKTGLRFPDLRLVGIQTRFAENRGILRGNLVGVWLDLVKAHYPDLRQTISGIKRKRGLKLAKSK